MGASYETLCGWELLGADYVCWRAQGMRNHIRWPQCGMADVPRGSQSCNQCTPSAKSQNYAVLNLQYSWRLVVSPQWVVQFSLVQFILAGSHRCHLGMGATLELFGTCTVTAYWPSCCQMKMMTLSLTVWFKQIFNCGCQKIHWRDCSDLLGLCVAEWDESW